MCLKDDQVCIDESIKRNQTFVAVGVICLVIVLVGIIAAFKRICYGQTALRGVKGNIEDDKSFKLK